MALNLWSYVRMLRLTDDAGSPNIATCTIQRCVTDSYTVTPSSYHLLSTQSLPFKPGSTKKIMFFTQTHKLRNLKSLTSNTSRSKGITQTKALTFSRPLNAITSSQSPIQFVSEETWIVASANIINRSRPCPVLN